MQKRLLFTSFVLLAFITAGYAQQSIAAYLEAPLHETEAAVMRFLTIDAALKSLYLCRKVTIAAIL